MSEPFVPYPVSQDEHNRLIEQNIILTERLAAAEARNERMFPILCERNAKPHPLQIPWSVAELAYSVYAAQYGRSQTLERLSQRGGFGPSEMDEYLPDWRERCSEVASLTARLAAAEEAARILFDELSLFTRTEWLAERWPWLKDEAKNSGGV